MSMADDFDDYKDGCPWVGEKEDPLNFHRICKGAKTHIGDMYLVCCKENCAPFHFINQLIEIARL